MVLDEYQIIVIWMLFLNFTTNFTRTQEMLTQGIKRQPLIIGDTDVKVPDKPYLTRTAHNPVSENQ